MDIINITCAEIQSAVGFVYGILSVILNHTHTDCEKSWYSEDGRLLADPSDPETLIDPVISVSSDRLVTSHCVDELRHEIICDTSGFRYETLFRVRNETAATSSSDQWWILALFIIIIIILPFLCFVLRKRIFGCNRIFRCGCDSRTQMKVRCEDHSAQESQQLKASETEV